MTDILLIVVILGITYLIFRVDYWNKNPVIVERWGSDSDDTPKLDQEWATGIVGVCKMLETGSQIVFIDETDSVLVSKKSKVEWRVDNLPEEGFQYLLEVYSAFKRGFVFVNMPHENRVLIINKRSGNVVGEALADGFHYFDEEDAA